MQSVNMSRGAIGGLTTGHVPTVSAAGSSLWRVFQAIPDLINGDPTGFAFIFVSAGLPMPWRWPLDAYFANMPLATTEDSIAARIVAEATFHSILLAADGMTADKARVLALVLASARVAIRRAWGVVDADTVATQRMDFPHANAGSAALDAVGDIITDVPDLATEGDWADERVHVSAVMDGLTDGFLARVMQVAIAMPVTSGVILVNTMVHHYVDPHKQISDAVIIQIFSETPQLPASITMDDLKDVLCHKASHVVDSPRLVGLARSALAGERLRAVGLGAASVRVPALFSAEKAAGALEALVNRGKQACAASNVIVSTTTVETMKAAVFAEIAAEPNQTGIRNAELVVESFKLANGHDVAWVAGFVTMQLQATNAQTRSRSIVNAWVVKGLIEEHADAFAEGSEHFSLAAKWRKTQARAGLLAGYGLMGGTAPAPFGDPDATSANTAGT